jgi:AcrR family transcriptional regulator
MRARKTGTEVRKEQITAAAMDLIAMEGVGSLSIAGIAGLVGITPSAFYRHYASKDDVLDAILEYLRTRLMGNVRAVKEETDNAPEQLKRLVARHVSLVSENSAIPQIVFSDSIYTGYPDRKAKVQGIIKGYLSQVRKIIAKGQKDGSIRNGYSPETIAVMFLGMILPAAVLKSALGGKRDMDKYVENAWSVFERGLMLDLSSSNPSD